MVYEAAEAAGVPSLARFALCGDRHAGTLLGQMGMTYAGFVASAPLAGQPALTLTLAGQPALLTP